MTELELLKAKDDIQQVVIEYAYALDTRDWAKLESLMVANIAGNYRSAQQPVNNEEIVYGRERLIARYRNYLERCGPTQHLLGNFQIDIHGDNATCRSYVRAMHVGTGYLRTTYYDQWGLYLDSLIRTQDGWKLNGRMERAFHEVGNRSVFTLEDDLA